MPLSSPTSPRAVAGQDPGVGKGLEGHLTEHHRFMLRLLWKETDDITTSASRRPE